MILFNFFLPISSRTAHTRRTWPIVLMKNCCLKAWSRALFFPTGSFRHLCVLSLPAKRLVRNSGKYCFQCVCKASLATGIEGAQKCKDSREPAGSRRTPFPLPSCSVCPGGQKGKVKSRPKTLHTGEKGELETAALKKQNQHNTQ